MNLYIDDKKTTTSEIMATLGLKHVTVPNPNRTRKFERLGVRDSNGNIKKDVQNGKPIMPASLSFKNSFDAPLPDGGYAKITYSPRQMPETINGTTRIEYAEPSITIPKEHKLLNPSEKNLFFWMWLNTLDKASPLNTGSLNPKVEYNFVDEESNARNLNDKEDAIAEALYMLKNLEIAQVRQLAKGYNLSHNIDNITDAEVRNLLRVKVKSNPSEFTLDMNNNNIAFDGIIKDAIDKGVFQQRASVNGIMWTLDGEDLAESRDVANAFHKIRNAVEADMEECMPKVLSGIKNQTKKQTLTAPLNDKFFGGFKTKEDVIFDKEDAKDITNYKNTEEHIAKLRKWAAMDPNDPKLHGNTKKALIDNAEDIEAQRQKDLAAAELENA